MLPEEIEGANQHWERVELLWAGQNHAGVPKNENLRACFCRIIFKWQTKGNEGTSIIHRTETYPVS